MPVWFLQAPNLISSADTLGQKPMPIPVAKEMHLWDIIISGGPIMIPLAVLFVLAIFFFFERYIAIKKAAKLEKERFNFCLCRSMRYPTLPEVVQD